MEVRKFTTQNITYESNRVIGTEHKLRVSLNILSNKEDSKGEIRDKSLHGTRETVFSCRCKGSHTELITNGECPMRAFSTIWRHRTELYQSLQQTYKVKEEFEKYWSGVKLILRVKYDDQGNVIGFYSGGKSQRGMSLKNIQQFYRKALILGGMDEEESKRYTFHGAKRAHVPFAKNFGGASDGDVVLGTKHARGGAVPHYNDASRSQLSKPGVFQGQLRDQMRAIIDFKASNSNPVLEECKTPPPSTGEVLRSNDTVSPTEVERV